MKSIFSLLLILGTSSFFGQDCDKVKLWGSVLDTTVEKGLYNLMIVNKTTGRGVFGKPDGSFSIYVNPKDSIYFTVSGYKTMITQVIPDSACSFEYHGILDLKEIIKNETVVYAIKTLSQIKEERERLAQVETRTVQGLQVVQSPITALYEQFSRREKLKKKLFELKFIDQMDQVVKELLRNYVSYDIIELSDDEYINFIRFLDLNEFFLKSASDYELILFIQEKYKHFRELNSPDYIYRTPKQDVKD